MVHNFKEQLINKIKDSQENNFGVENFDEYRFGKYQLPALSTKQKIKNGVKKAINYRRNPEKYIRQISNYMPGLQKLWQNINEEGKELLVDIVALKLCGYTKIKLPLNNPVYWKSLDTAKSLAQSNDTYDPHFLHFILEKFDLRPIGFDIKMYFSAVGIAIDFIIEQYAYKNGSGYVVHAEKGDIILDVGGCWGDTALYFAHKVGEGGKVYSFEFIPDNIKLHNVNTRLNPLLDKQIVLVPNPVAAISDQVIYFQDNGPSSTISDKPFEGQTGFTSTRSIDDFVKQNAISRVDYIKMDIEGAEPNALKGAIETIRKFRPKLAIAIYHSMDDFVNIPEWIIDLQLDYEIFIGHYTIHTEETICFAKPKTSGR